MITGHSTYVDFFRTACVKHIEILHNTPDKHFARIVLTYDPLLGSNAQIREFISGKRFALKSPVILLVSYMARYNDDRSDNIVKTLGGALIVLKPSKEGDFDGEETVFDDTERLGGELMGYADEKLVLPQYLDWNGSGNERLSNIEGYSGTRFDFNIVHPAYEEIKWQPSQFGE